VLRISSSLSITYQVPSAQHWCTAVSPVLWPYLTNYHTHTHTHTHTYWYMDTSYPRQFRPTIWSHSICHISALVKKWLAEELPWILSILGSLEELWAHPERNNKRTCMQPVSVVAFIIGIHAVNWSTSYERLSRYAVSVIASVHINFCQREITLTSLK